mgnify:FL=1
MNKILILRAHEDALRTAEKLRQFGFDSIVSPVIKIHATHAKAPTANCDALIASSAKAFETADDLERFLHLPMHAVGAKTALSARNKGFEPEIVAGNAEAILPLLLQKYPKPTHFLYLAGRDRQSFLEDGLRQAGHIITLFEVYKAEAAQSMTQEAENLLRENQLAAALHYSKRSVEIFIQLAATAQLTANLSNIDHFALSKDVARPLELIQLSPYVADKPNETQLLKLTVETLQKRL